MNAQAIVALVACTLTLVISIITAAWRVASRIAKLETTVAPLVGINDRVTKLETRVERHEDILSAAFEVVPTGERH